jgi:hypothetical protein
MSKSGRLFERRDSRRSSVLHAARLLAGHDVCECEVLNISEGGAKVRVNGRAPLDNTVTLSIDELGDFVTEVVWRKDEELGLRFVGESANYIAALMQIAPDKLRSPKSLRRFTRVSVVLRGTLYTPDDQRHCVVMDISAGGARLRGAGALELETPVTLYMDRFGEFPAQVVWHDGEQTGVGFLQHPREIVERLCERLPKVSLRTEEPETDAAD